MFACLRALLDDLLGLRGAEREPDGSDPLHRESGERPRVGDSAASGEGLEKDKLLLIKDFHHNLYICYRDNQTTYPNCEFTSKMTSTALKFTRTYAHFIFIHVPRFP